MAMNLKVAPDLKTYLTYSIEFWRLVKSKEKLIPQYDNWIPRRYPYEIFANWRLKRETPQLVLPLMIVRQLHETRFWGCVVSQQKSHKDVCEAYNYRIVESIFLLTL